jgi:hypothetical protein
MVERMSDGDPVGKIVFVMTDSKPAEPEMVERMTEPEGPFVGGPVGEDEFENGGRPVVPLPNGGGIPVEIGFDGTPVPVPVVRGGEVLIMVGPVLVEFRTPLV